MPDQPPPQDAQAARHAGPPHLAITPKSVTLRAFQSQAFEVTADGDPAQNIEWSIEPNKPKQFGTIEPHKGVYTAPSRIYFGKQVAVTAKVGVNYVSADVELTPISFWTHILGAYWMVLGAILVLLVLSLWPRLCPSCKPPEVIISPSIATLTAGQQQRFTANMSVTWGDPLTTSGFYIAPAPSQVEKAETKAVKATSTDDARKTGSATVVLSPGPPDTGLSIYPQNSKVLAEGTTEFQALGGDGKPVDVDWLPPALGKISNGKYEAPQRNLVRCPQWVEIVARTKTPPAATTKAAPARLAGAYVTVLPISGPNRDIADGCQQSAGNLLALITLMGSLGGLIHGAFSFAIFVGNRELRSSWMWWYFLRPALGGLMGLVVYLVIRAGFGGTDLALSSADCMKVAAFAGLIGLFAEQASVKLKDIFETIFTPKKDPRKDAIAAGDKKDTAPHIDKAVIQRQGDNAELLITGSNFAQGSKVTVNGQERTTVSVAATQITATLKPEDVTAGKTLVVKVVSAGGASSNEVKATAS